MRASVDLAEEGVREQRDVFLLPGALSTSGSTGVVRKSSAPLRNSPARE
jgi:hypothetical protein